MTAVRPAAAGEVLLERGPERGRLTRLVAGLGRGESSAAVVIGVPGTGKTTLLEHTAETAARAGVRVLTARGSATESLLPHGVISQLFAGVPGLSELLWPRSAQPGGRGPGWQEKVCNRLLDSTRWEPTLLIVDDFDLADDRSAAWLTAVLRRRTRTPLMILLAHARVASPVGDSAAITAWWQAAPLPGTVHVVHLRPLTPDAVRRVVDVACTGRAAPGFAAELATLTRDDPTLLREVLARLETSGPDPDLSAVAADARRAVVLDLLERLRPDLAELLRVVAVARTAEEDYLRPLAGTLGMPVGVALRGLAELGLLGAGPERRMDPEVATWVLAGMAPRRRDRLRRAAAEIGHRRAAPEEDVAALLLDSTPIGEPWAADTLCAAAVRWRAAGDYAAAAACYHRALDEPLSPARAARVRVELETVERASCPFTADLRLLQASQASAADRSVRTRLSAVDLMIQRGACGQALRELRELHRSPELTGADRGDLIALHWLAEGRGTGSARSGVPAFADLDPATLSPAQSGAAAWLTTATGRGIRVARRLARRASAAPAEQAPLLAPRLAAAATLTATDDVLEALAAYDSVIRAGSKAGARVPVALALTGQAGIHLQRGRPAGVDEALAAIRALGEPGSWPAPVHDRIAAVTLLVAIFRDGPETARRTAVPHPGTTEDPASPYLLFARGLLELVSHRHHDALYLLQECGRRMLAAGWANPSMLPWRAYAVIACRRVGDHRGATAWLAEEWDLTKAWGGRTAVGYTHLAAGTGIRGQDALFQLTQAVNALQRSPSRLLYVDALLRLAAALLESGQPAGVARHLREAERIAAGAQLTPITARVAALRARLADRPGPRISHRLALRRWRSLPPPALELVRAVLEGTSNAAIAERLAVSKRSVELRLTAIYRQLEITGRAELRELFAVLEGELGAP
ncbi:AAA family ATPase [Amycolatopsis panacis]|uniref:LuxR family transcriptional regulator n=1 Tax=Amycolatopsis panacis TaxID=2340917 RepID=A0A419HK85_9PSEU|nr:AAA family ATPase [Amycolatopsis panacis]RJQ76179.1 LuxR family transcriptional regulator [Amycolatopsis panacis]